MQLASFGLGVLCALCALLLLGAGGESFSPDEVIRLKTLASYVQPDGNLNLGNRKIVMLGSSIYDDGSEGGGLILRGGANRILLRTDAGALMLREARAPAFAVPGTAALPRAAHR